MIAKFASEMASKFQMKVMDKVLPEKPSHFLECRPESLKKILPYESYFEDCGRDVFVLSDGALGVIWKVDAIPHELQSESDLRDTMIGVTKVFDAVSGERFSFQFIYDGESSREINEPDWIENPDTFARFVIKERIEAIKNLAENPGDKPKLIKRTHFLTLRVEYADKRTIEKGLSGADDQYFSEQVSVIEEATTVLRDAAKVVEDILFGCAKLKTRRVVADDFLISMRAMFSPNNRIYGHNADRRLGDQIVNETVEWSNDAIAIGEDLWEVISWADQPNVEFAGMMAELLKIDMPIRCIVNIRPANNTKGLAGLANAVKNGGDALKERQREEVYETEKRLTYGETLMAVSMHILVKNEHVAMSDPASVRGAENLCKQLTASTNIPFFVEKFATQAIIMACLPLCYSKGVAGFVGRECRVLSSATGSYLPLFCGTRGEDRPMQLMQSRAGEAVWINPRCSPTNPHVAVLGSSGGGKSFYLTNLILSELASNPDAIVFHIDCITSCEYLAKAVGEEIGYEISKPPYTFPNLFKGEITRERLPTIVSVVEAAVSLASEEKLSAAEKVILSDSIMKTYEDNKSFSESSYQKGEDGMLGTYVDEQGRRRIPRLSEVVNSFTAVCQLKSVDEAVGTSLREKLLPLFGSGPYAIAFDREEFENTSEEHKVGYYLYDLAGVQGDKVLSTVTSLIVIADYFRILADERNKGRKGLLIIDECGVNLSGKSEHLEAFVNEKWPTLRKKGIVCIGLTNKADHYSDLPAPSTIWNISANKVILPMTKDDIVVAERKQLIQEPIYFSLIKSLQKKKGEYSECLWIGDGMSGTFSYVPTGFDYWAAINQDNDVSNLEYVYSETGTYRAAMGYMAKHFPKGVLDEYGDPRQLNDDEKTKIKGDLDDEISSN